MKRGYAETPEGQIHYIEEGSGTPLLLVHMTPRSSTMFNKVIPLLSENHRVIALDILGFGNSDPAPSSYTHIGAYAENIVHFLDVLNVECADVIAIYSGSVIAVELAVQFPERVRRQVLLPFSMWSSEEERAERIKEAKRLAWITTRGDGLHVSDVLQFAFRRKVDSNNPVDEQDYEYMNDWIVDAVKCGERATDMALKVYTYASESRLPLVKAPTLVVGLAGEIVPWHCQPSRTEEMRSLIPNSEFVVLQGRDADARIFYNRPQDVADAVLPFLSEPNAG